MATVGRVLLWTVVLVAPGGFLLVPVLAAASLHGRNQGPQTLREQLRELLGAARAKLQAYWTKS
jgi:hypothetical protein